MVSLSNKHLLYRYSKLFAFDGGSIAKFSSSILWKYLVDSSSNTRDFSSSYVKKCHLLVTVFKLQINIDLDFHIFLLFYFSSFTVLMTNFLKNNISHIFQTRLLYFKGNKIQKWWNYFNEVVFAAGINSSLNVQILHIIGKCFILQ